MGLIGNNCFVEIQEMGSFHFYEESTPLESSKSQTPYATQTGAECDIICLDYPNKEQCANCFKTIELNHSCGCKKVLNFLNYAQTPLIPLFPVSR
jgi:hypothetical protein